MTAFGGDNTKASDVNLRVGTTTATTNGSTTSGTTELAVDQVTATVVNGQLYQLRWVVKFTGTTGSDKFVFRIREGSGTGGTERQSVQENIATGYTLTVIVDVDWTASSSGSQTFTGTVARISGTGTVSILGATTQVRSLTVEKVQTV